MKKNSMRFLSFLLLAMMMVSVLTLGVFAEDSENVAVVAENTPAAKVGNTEVATYEELLAALAEGGKIKLTADITATATQSSGYGKAGIEVDADDILDGNGHVLTIKGAGATWDCAIAMKGGVVKNLTIAGAMRGIFMPGANGDVVIDNCVFKDVIYTFNSDAGSKDYTVTVKNTTLNGWTSFSDVHKSVTFEDCVFGKGSGYAFCRPYQATTFVDCAFEKGFELDTKSTNSESLAFNDCTYAGEKLSADNSDMFYNGGYVKIDGNVVNMNFVAKVGEKKYVTLADAIETVADGGTVTLVSDVVFTKDNRTHNSGSWYDGLYYVGDKSFTIDLGGFTITHDGSVNDYLLNFKNVGNKANTITIKNGTVDAGTVAFCAICTSSVQENQLTINLENLNVINNISNGSTIKVRGGVILNVKDGTVITGTNSYLGIECVASTVNIYDGAEIYMNGTSSYNGCLVGACGGGTVNVYGGYGKGVKGGFIAMTSGGTINVSGGEWIANTDGTVGNNSNLYVLTAQNNKQESGYVGASIINVYGGTFRGGMDAWVLNDAMVEKAELNIAGGNFNADPKAYVEAGFAVVSNNGVFEVVKAVANIGDTYYATLEEAFKAATSGCEIEILDDVVIDYKWDCRYTGSKITVPVTIDGNGHTLKLTGTVDDKNWNTVFRFEADVNILNLTIDVSEATGVQRVITTKLGMFVNKCTIIGNDSVRYGIIYGEGAGADIANVEVAIFNSTFRNLVYGVSDNRNGQDAKDILMQVNVFENASLLLSASKKVEVSRTKVTNGFASIVSYTVPNNLTVNCLSSSFDKNFAEKNIVIAAKHSYCSAFRTPVADVAGKLYIDLQEAIKAAAPNGTVEILCDVAVDEWIMIAENLTTSDGTVITLGINGMTINGNGHTVTIKDIESAGNGGYLFYNAAKLNVNDLTITYADGLTGGIGLKSGTISEVTFNGGKYGVLPGANGVTIEGCTFNGTKGTAIYCEDARSGIVVTNNTFNTASGAYAITMRDNEQFTDNTIINGRVNLANSAKSTVTGNDFGTERFKVYNGATATISGNTINNLVFNDDTVIKSVFTQNTFGDDAKAVYEARLVARIGEKGYFTIADAIKAANAGDTVTVLEGTYAMPSMKAGITIVGEGEVLFEGTLTGTLENLTLKNIHIKGSNAQRWAYAKGDLVFENVTFEATSVYALHFDGIAEGTNLLYKNCTIIGWAAMGGSPASCVFDGCTIKGNGAYGVIRTYFDATIKDCTFDVSNVNATDVYEDGIHAVEGATVTVNNCTNKNGDMAGLVNVGDMSVVKVDDVVFQNYAKIGDTYYLSLADAMNACKAGETVLLLHDVDLAGTEWEPVSFKGAFNGQGHTISNLTINKPGVSNVGFITSLNSTFENVTFTNPTVTGGECTGVIAGRAGGSAALAKNITVNGTIKVETTHSGYARVAVIVGGWAYGNYENITVDGGDKAVSYVKHTGGGDGRYVAGIVGHADSVSAYTNCTVKNITIDGKWLCGAIAGPGPANTVTSGCVVENVNIAADYSGGMFGWYFGSGTIQNSSIKNVTFTDGSTNNGAIGGYSANTNAKVENVTFENVKNADGKPLLEHVASIGDQHFLSLAEALAAAQNGDTITLIWKNGAAPIAMNGAVFGKSVTITGTATVDWSKGFLFIGRGGAGNGTVIFDNANLTSASNSASYGIHVSGREKGTADKYDGTLVIKNSTIELDFLINKGTMTLDNSTLTVKNGFSIGGRPASETESGVDATATITLNNGSKVVVNNHNGMGLGYEAIGVMNVDSTSTFECTGDFLVTDKGTLNVNGGTVKVAGTLTNNGTIKLTNTDLTDMTIEGAGTTYFYDEINFYGANTVTTGINGTPFELIVNKGATLLISRFVLGYNRNITVYGVIEDAHAFDPTGKTPSLKFNSTSGVSVGGTDTGNLTVKDAYVELGNSSWKNAYGTYDWSFENSYVSAVSFTNTAAGSSVSAKWTVTFDDSVLVAKNYIKNGVGTTYNFTNGSVATTGSLCIDGVMNIDATSSVTTTAQQNNKVGAVDEHGGINGTVNVEGTLTIGSNAKTQLEMLGGTLNVKGGTVALGNNTLTLDAASVMTSTGNISGTITAADGAKISITGGTYTQDVSDWCADGYKCEAKDDGTFGVREIVNLIIKVGPVASRVITNEITVATMDEAVAYARANFHDSVTYQITGPVVLTTGGSHGIINLGSNVTIEGLTPDAKLTIVGGGVPDFKGVTFKNITLADEGTYLPTANEFMYQNYIDCTFVNVTFEEGIRVSGNTTITGCTIKNNKNNQYALWSDGGNVTMTGTTVTVDGEGYGMVKSDKATEYVLNGNTFEYKNDANKEALNTNGATINASGNTFIGCVQGIIPADKTNYAADGTILTAGAIATDNLVAVAKIGNTYYATLAEAFAAIGSGDVVIELLADATFDYNARDAYGLADTTSITINGNGYTLTLNQKNSDWASLGMAKANGKLVLNDMTIEKTGYGDTSGAWNTHAIIFSCNVEMNNVTVNNGIAVQNGATLKNVTINEANGYYGLWINGNGQTVTVNGGAINATNGGRGIKIADQYIDAPASVTLNVTGTVFNTAKKAAVLVSSKAGAAITAANVNITNVAEDSTNIAWVDEDWATYFGNVTVNDAPAAQEAADSFTAAIMDGEKVVGYYKTLQAAIDAAQNGDTIKLLADSAEDVTIKQTEGVNITIDGNRKKYSGTIYVHGNSNYGDETLTIKNFEFVTNEANHDFIWSDSQNAPARYPHNVTIDDCSFKAEGDAVNSAVAIRIRQGKNIIVTNSTAEGLHSFMQASGTKGIKVDNVTVTGCKNGISIGTSDAVITNSTINTSGYGIRADGTAANSLIVTDVAIEANQPVIVRKLTAAGFKLSVIDCDLDATSSDGYKVIMTAGDDDVAYIVPVTTDYTLDTDSNNVYPNSYFVAMIGNQGYLTITEALAAVKNGETIKLVADTNENITIKQVEGVNITIDGNGKKYSGTITIHGNARHTGAETLTIQNVNFVTDKAGHYFIDSNSTASAERYAHNVTVKNCTFTATGAGENSAAAMRIRQGYNISIENVTATGLHSVLQAYGNSGITVDGLTINSGKNGISAGTSTKVVVKNSKINVSGYGVRADGEGAYDLTVRNSEITADLPVVIRKATGAYVANVAEGNTLTATNDNGYTIVVTTGDDDETFVAPSDVKLLVNAGANDKVFGMAAKIGNTYYGTFAQAYAAAKADDTIVLFAPVVITVDTELDLTGKTVDGNGVYPAFRVQNDATLTVKGGTIINATDYVFVLGASNQTSAGNLVIENGTFKGQTSVASVTKGTLTIKGGTFECLEGAYGSAYLLNCVDANYKNGSAKIEIVGGTFKGFNPQNNASEGANTNFLTTEYAVTFANGYYTVVDSVAHIDGFGYATVADAIKGAKKGDTIVLRTSIVVTKDESYDFTGLTVDGNGVYPAFRVQNGATLTVNGGNIKNSDYIFVLGASDGTSIGNVVINGGSFYGETTVASVTKGTLTINGGEFRVDAYENGQNFNYMLNCVDANYNKTASIVVKGGTFYNFNPADNAAEGVHTNFVADGYHSVSNGNGSFTVGKHNVKTHTQGATCTSNGLTYSFCTECGKMIKAPELTPMVPHDYQLVPGDHDNGYEVYKCTTCDDKYTGDKLIADVIVTVDGIGYTDWAKAMVDMADGAQMIVLYSNVNNDLVTAIRGISKKAAVLDLNGYTLEIKELTLKSGNTMYIVDSSAKKTGSVIVSRILLEAGNDLRLADTVYYNGAVQMNNTKTNPSTFYVGDTRLVGTDGIFTIDQADTGYLQLILKDSIMDLTLGVGHLTMINDLSLLPQQKLTINVYGHLTIAEHVVLTLDADTTLSVLENNHGKGQIDGKGTIVVNTLDQFLTVLDTDIENIVLGTAMTISKDLTLDISGKTITATGDAFIVTAGTLTINGNGVVKAGTSGVGSWCAVWANGGNVVINGGTYSVGGDSNTTGTHQNDVIYTKNKGTVVINGGLFLNDGTVWTLNQNDTNGGKITVNGGSFENWNPANNVSEGADTNFLADGLCTAENNGIYEVVKHSYNAVVTAPTCTDKGYTTYTCSACGDTYVADETAALGHKYNKVVTDPTCTTEGYTTYTCSVCGDTYVADKVAAKGHTVAIDDAVAPTCTATGLTVGVHCSVCNEVLVKQETVAAKGHTEVIDAAVGATCTATGLTEGKHCSVCNTVLVAQTVVDALGHTWTPATFEAPKTCSVCGVTEGEALHAVAQIGAIKYATLAEAIAAAQNGDTITLLTNSTGSGVVINKSITIDFAGCTYSFDKGVGSTGTQSNGFQILKGNTVTLKNGTLNVAASAADKFYILIQNYADLTVTDMILDGTNLDKWSLTDGDSYTLSNNSGNVVVNGNTIIIANNDGKLAFAFDACDKTNNGYTLPTVTVADTVTVKGNVEAAAKVGNTYYATFDAALAAAEAGDTIKLIVPVTVTADKTINIEGITIESEGDAFIVTAGTLTINGNGVVKAGTSGVGSWCAVWANGGKVVINDGTYSVGGDENATNKTHQNDVIYTKNGGTVEINGGLFLNDGTVWTLNQNDTTGGKIIVNGGTFQNWNPANNVSEGPKTNFLAEGYFSIKDGDNYVVTDCLMGDVNGNGRIDTNDVTMLKRYLKGILTPGQLAKLDLSVADMNGDGIVDVADVSLIGEAYQNSLNSTLSA